MDKIFTAITDTTLSSQNFSTINEFLKENPDFYIKSVTPIHQSGENNFRKYGVVVVVTNRE